MKLKVMFLDYSPGKWEAIVSQLLEPVPPEIMKGYVATLQLGVADAISAHGFIAQSTADLIVPDAILQSIEYQSVWELGLEIACEDLKEKLERDCGRQARMQNALLAMRAEVELLAGVIAPAKYAAMVKVINKGLE